MTASAQRRTPSAPRAALVALAAVAVLAACLLAPAAAPAAKRLVKPSALPAFPSCASLLSYARRNARITGGRTGVPTRAGVMLPQVLEGPVQGDVASGGPLASPSRPRRPPRRAIRAGRAGVLADQRAGVRRRRARHRQDRWPHGLRGTDGRLRALDVTGARPRLVGTLALDGAYGHQLLLRGDRLLVMSSSYGGVPIAGDIVISASQAVISEIDISDPAALKVRRTMTMEGAFVDARMTGGTARVVISASPGAIRPAAVGRASLRTFVPQTVLRSTLSGKTFRRSMVACDDVRHPRRFSGLDLLTVLTIDLDKGLFNVDRDAIMAGAQTVYASTTGLYVASQRYVSARGRARGAAAQPHRHPPLRHLSPDVTSFAASGSVTGFVLNQYSMSEFEGALRVASTEEPVWFDGRQDGESESFVTVLSSTAGRWTWSVAPTASVAASASTRCASPATRATW